MADHQGDRTEAATPRRKEEAKKKGQIPKTKEAGAAAVLLTGGLLVQTGGEGLAYALRDLFGNSLRALGSPGGRAVTADFLTGVGWTMLAAMAPVLLCLAGVALAVGALQGRGVLTTEPLRPKAEKLDVVKNAQRIWGWQAPAELAKSLLKLAIVGVAVYTVLGSAIDEIPSLAQRSPMALLAVIRTYGGRILLAAGAAFVLLAVADYAFQVWQHARQLRMSRQEIKQEHKETEGDPNVKARRRSMAASVARRRMMLAVSEADVVITNPTHVAVALKYDPDTADAPVVVAMGARKVAERIKKLAREASVPTVENKPLARSLLASAKVGSPIPVELYVAVAEVLAWVLRQRGGYEPRRDR